MWFFILLLIVVLIGLLYFISWFVNYRKSGKCPLCALEKMGWSSWNTFKQNISEELILSTAAAMRLSGLTEAGYQYINIDDCWHSSFRDENGRLQGDLGKFPSGIPAVIEKINHMGMKV